MSKRSLAMISLCILSCKTTPAKVTSDILEGSASSPAACNETCAGTFASAKILGCVEACDQWVGKTLKINSGASLYKDLPPSQRCSFTYEKRNADQVHKGSFHQLFSFGFRYTDGIGDGDFLITGPGMSNRTELIDFTKDRDEKVFGTDSSGGSTSLIFIRDDSAQGHVPTFKIEEIDAKLQESKTLTLVLNKKFDNFRPFVAVQLATFKSIVHGDMKHDISCTY
jgi:hypothetical protein